MDFLLSSRFVVFFCLLGVPLFCVQEDIQNDDLRRRVLIQKEINNERSKLLEDFKKSCEEMEKLPYKKFLENAEQLASDSKRQFEEYTLIEKLHFSKERASVLANAFENQLMAVLQSVCLKRREKIQAEINNERSVLLADFKDSCEKMIGSVDKLPYENFLEDVEKLVSDSKRQFEEYFLIEKLDFSEERASVLANAFENQLRAVLKKLFRG